MWRFRARSIIRSLSRQGDELRHTHIPRNRNKLLETAVTIPMHSLKSKLMQLSHIPTTVTIDSVVPLLTYCNLTTNIPTIETDDTTIRQYRKSVNRSRHCPLSHKLCRKFSKWFASLKFITKTHTEVSIRSQTRRTVIEIEVILKRPSKNDLIRPRCVTFSLIDSGWWSFGSADFSMFIECIAISMTAQRNTISCGKLTTDWFCFCSHFCRFAISYINLQMKILIYQLTHHNVTNTIAQCVPVIITNIVASDLSVCFFVPKFSQQL